MAARLHPPVSKTPVPPRAPLPPTRKTRLGQTAVDKVCQDCHLGQYLWYVDLKGRKEDRKKERKKHVHGKVLIRSCAVVAVYGILFMDTPGHKSIFEEVCPCDLCISLAVADDTKLRSWYEEGTAHEIPDNTPIRQALSDSAEPVDPALKGRSVGGPSVEMRNRWT